MEVRSLFNVIIKIIGIFFIKDILEAFSRILSILVYLPQYSTENEGYFNLGIAIPPLVLYGLFVYVLIFRTNSVIQVLKLDKNISQQQVTLPIDRTIIFKLAIIIIGGYMLINELAEFFRLATYYVQERKLYARMARPDVSYLATSAAKIIFALGLLFWNKRIVTLLEKLFFKNR